MAGAGCAASSNTPPPTTAPGGGAVFGEVADLRRSEETPELFALECADPRALPLVDGVAVDPASVTGTGADLTADTLALPAGEGVFSFTVDRGDTQSTIWVRCLPEGFPEFTTEGRFSTWLALTTANHDPAEPGFQVLLDSSGFPLWVRDRAGALSDFYVRDAAVLSFTARPLPLGPYYNSASFGYTLEEFDGSTRVSWITGSGSGPDFHAAEILPNGNLLTILYEVAPTPSLAQLGRVRSDPQVSTVKACPAGPVGPDAEVVRGRVAEIAPGGEIVRSWRVEEVAPLPIRPGWVNINGPGEPLRCVLDADHLNAVSFLQDPAGAPGEGSVLVGGRSLDGAIALDWPSGKLRWTLGLGDAPRALRVLGDPLDGPRLAHDARLLGPDLVSFLDNRVDFDGSRAAIYRVDPAAMTATLEESYTTPCGVNPCSSIALGSVRPVGTSSLLISWGVPSRLIASEVSRPGGTVGASLASPEDGAYRVLPVDPFDAATLLRAQQR
jgi:hypothetical protein